MSALLSSVCISNQNPTLPTAVGKTQGNAAFWSVMLINRTFLYYSGFIFRGTVDLVDEKLFRFGDSIDEKLITCSTV